MIARPGAREQDVITKKRNPHAKAASGETPRLPKKLTKKASRTPRPLTVNGTSMTRKSSGPEHDVREHGQVDPDGAPRGVDGEDPRELKQDGHGGDDEQGPAVIPVAVDPVVDGPGRRLEPQLARERQQEREPAAHRAREEDDTRDQHPTTKIPSGQR